MEERYRAEAILEGEASEQRVAAREVEVAAQKRQLLRSLDACELEREEYRLELSKPLYVEGFGCVHMMLSVTLLGLAQRVFHVDAFQPRYE